MDVSSRKKLDKLLVRVRPFSGAKVNCMINHLKPAMRDDKPDHVILHSGTNYLRSEIKSNCQSITEIAM